MPLLKQENNKQALNIKIKMDSEINNKRIEVKQINGDCQVFNRDLILKLYQYI